MVRGIAGERRSPRLVTCTEKLSTFVSDTTHGVPYVSHINCAYVSHIINFVRLLDRVHNAVNIIVALFVCSQIVHLANILSLFLFYFHFVVNSLYLLCRKTLYAVPFLAW